MSSLVQEIDPDNILADSAASGDTLYSTTATSR